MQIIQLQNLAPPVRDFLARAEGEGFIAVEDDQGRVRYGISMMLRSSPEQQKAAWKAIEVLQAGVGESMRRQGVNETDVDGLLNQDD